MLQKLRRRARASGSSEKGACEARWAPPFSLAPLFCFLFAGNVDGLPELGARPPATAECRLSALHDSFVQSALYDYSV